MTSPQTISRKNKVRLIKEIIQDSLTLLTERKLSDLGRVHKAKYKEISDKLKVIVKETR